MSHHDRKLRLTSRSGCGARKGCQWWPERGRAEIIGALARNCTKYQQTQNDGSTMHMTRRKMQRQKKKRELGMCDLPCAHTPRVSISVRGRDNNTGPPRVWGSDCRRFCLALPARILERCATSTGQSLRHEALVNSGPYAGATVRTTLTVYD